jgi:hypothetical protein
MARVRALAGFALVVGALGALSCSDRVEVGFDSARGGASSGGVSSGGSTTLQGGTGGAIACVKAQCQGKQYACGNCTDDDADGLADAQDPDCLGPCDDTEDSFYLGIPGQNGGGCRQDCHFDRDSGAGNDGCDWSFSCDPLSVAPGYPPSGMASCAYDPQLAIQGQSCADLASVQAAGCLDYCLPLTPNGCDCFGCCELPARSGKYVFIGSGDGDIGTCSRATLSDENACRPCTPVPSCLNECEACELCAGETKLPAACTGSQPTCAGGRVACGPGASCPEAMFCITGCCVDVPR